MRSQPDVSYLYRALYPFLAPQRWTGKATACKEASCSVVEIKSPLPTWLSFPGPLCSPYLQRRRPSNSPNSRGENFTLRVWEPPEGMVPLLGSMENGVWVTAGNRKEDMLSSTLSSWLSGRLDCALMEADDAPAGRSTARKEDLFVKAAIATRWRLQKIPKPLLCFPTQSWTRRARRGKIKCQLWRETFPVQTHPPPQPPHLLSHITEGVVGRRMFGRELLKQRPAPSQDICEKQQQGNWLICLQLHRALNRWNRAGRGWRYIQSWTGRI